jgi:TPR repeat protein
MMMELILVLINKRRLIGDMYEYGDGIEKDINKAIYWYEKSAKQRISECSKCIEKLKKVIRMK